MENKHIATSLPVQIYETDNRFWTPEVQEYCDNFSDRENHSTNVKADMSSWYLYEETTIFNTFFDWILETVNSHPLAPFLQNWSIGTAWLAKYKEGESTVPHHHFPAHLSFVYFLKCSEKSSPLNLEGVDIECREGRLILFPSLMFHHVTATPEERIVLAGNINWMPPPNSTPDVKTEDKLW